MRSAWVAAALLAAACSDPEPEPDAGTGIDADSDAGADSGACSVVCVTVMDGEHRAECADARGRPCGSRSPVCDPASVPETDRARLFPAPRCLEVAAGAPAPYCGLSADGETPLFPEPPVVGCAP